MSVQLVHPASYVDGARQVDTSVTAEAYQLRPDDVDGLISWADAQLTYRGADAGLLLFDNGRVIGPVPLGDYVVRRDDQLLHEPADRFWQRYEAGGAP